MYQTQTPPTKNLTKNNRLGGKSLGNPKSDFNRPDTVGIKKIKDEKIKSINYVKVNENASEYKAYSNN